MKKHIFPLSLMVAIMAVLFSSCKKEQCDLEPEISSVPITERTSSCNPYSLRIMQAALDSLLSTRAVESSHQIILEPTDYYFRISAVDTVAIASLKNMNVEVFDYPLDREFEDDTDYYLDPQEFNESEMSWSYLALSPQYAVEEIPYDSVLEAEENNSFIKVVFAVSDNRISGDLLDECYVPEHAATTRSGSSLPVSPEALEAMAYKIAGVPQEGMATRASSYTSGFINVKNGSSNLPVKGVKVRIQKFLKWRTVYTNEYGYFYVSESFSKPNISVIFNNKKDFTIWGNWAFLAPATFTKQSCTTSSSFQLSFDRNTDYSPWSWSVVNNAAYDYYKNCSSFGILKDVSIPPSNMRIWCLNVDWPGVGGGAPMMKHLITSRVLSGASAVLAYMASLGWVAAVVTIAVAAAINILGPDILMVTYNKTYNNLYATTFHELSHASHFNSIGEWNYGKMIWYEMTHGDKKNFYGTGGTGADGEGFCEVSETYAFSIENYIRKTLLYESSPSNGESSSYFFNKYVSTLSSLLINGTLTPGQIYSCMSSSIRDMNSLMTALCNKYPLKKAAIQTEMTNNGL